VKLVQKNLGHFLVSQSVGIAKDGYTHKLAPLQCSVANGSHFAVVQNGITYSNLADVNLLLCHVVNESQGRGWVK
jgi:hypothetical protein